MVSVNLAVITGGTGGIGAAVAGHLARLGWRLIIVGRDLDRGRAMQSSLQHVADARFVAADLATIAGVEKAAAAIQHDDAAPSLLVNCASAVFSERVLTEDGIERTFALNHLSYFHLTGLLAPRMLQASGATILNIAAAQWPGMTIDLQNLQGERRYDGAEAYIRSKLANVMFTYGLARRLIGMPIVAHAVHPGIVKTSLGVETTRGLLRAFGGIARQFGESAEAAAERIVSVASHGPVAGGAGFFAYGHSRRSSAVSYDRALQDRLWEESVRVLGRDPYAWLNGRIPAGQS